MYSFTKFSENDTYCLNRETKPLQFSCMNNCDANDQTNQALPRPKFGQSPEILSMIELCNEKSQNVCYSVTKIAKITKITKFCRAFNKSDKEMRIRGQERPSTKQPKFQKLRK